MHTNVFWRIMTCVMNLLPNTLSGVNTTTEKSLSNWKQVRHSLRQLQASEMTLVVVRVAEGAVEVGLRDRGGWTFHLFFDQDSGQELREKRYWEESARVASPPERHGRRNYLGSLVNLPQPK